MTITHNHACVIGRPDRQWGEIVVAYVVGKASAEDLDALCTQHIARFKRPKDYVFVDDLPKNNYGKILKTDLRKRDSARCGLDGRSNPAPTKPAAPSQLDPPSGTTQDRRPCR